MTIVTSMRINRIVRYAAIGLGIACFAMVDTSCTLPASLTVHTNENKNTPQNFNTYSSQDTVNTARISWKEFFTDPNLSALIDSALGRNQELNILRQEITIAQNE